MANFTPQPMYLLGKNPYYTLVGGWVGPRAGLDAVVRRKILRN
jgi:hypothetical protein